MPNDFNQYQPYTGFTTTSTGSVAQDLGQRYTTKSYLLDVYPNISSTLGSRTSPGLWGWGWNSSGQLGIPDIVNNRSSPVQVGLLATWKSIEVGEGTLGAIKTDGTLWVSGYNYYGQLGLNNLVHRSSPTQVGSLTNWKQIAFGRLHTMAVKTDGTLWSWGHNHVGQLGQSNITHRSSPVQVGSLTNWKLVNAGYYNSFTAAIKTDGTLWVWGHNSYGQLGLSTLGLAHRSSPTQVGSLTNWKQVASGRLLTMAVKTDGTLWGWGTDGNGFLFGGVQSSPVQVGSLTDWKLISSGQYHLMAVKTNGTLWAWGFNAHGELGIGDTTNRSSPVQVGLLTNWKFISAGQYITSAIKTDGTLWAWGNNSFGELGLGNDVHRSSPTQVGSLTNWKQIAVRIYSTGAIQDGSY